MDTIKQHKQLRGRIGRKCRITDTMRLKRGMDWLIVVNILCLVHHSFPLPFWKTFSVALLSIVALDSWWCLIRPVACGCNQSEGNFDNFA